ncbi:MAG: NAD(P)H-dependent oxidoreductase subunit E [bacterium]|nr:NAD(P)H-dependent oxidoreductase subunit E [Acidimicrobiia bacterium]MCY4649977.1 NAD(P)H-dependent oxidoreductase subunit E [bacterium]
MVEIRSPSVGKSWSEETRNRASEIIASYPQPRSAVMPLLYLAMAEEGYLTDHGMREVARRVGLTPAQVRSVASFYTMYKREDPGSYLISCCTSISCMLLGSDEILKAIEDETEVLAEQGGAEGLVTVEHVECIGACGGAPAVTVNYELIEGISVERAREMVRWLNKARPETVGGAELQELFGGRRSFDWGPFDRSSAVGPYPAFGPLGTVSIRSQSQDGQHGE